MKELRPEHILAFGIGGAQAGGKTNAIIQAFKDSPMLEMSIYCGTKRGAESLCERVKSVFKLNAEVVEGTHYGQPITKVYDELTDPNPRIEIVPNETKSYSVKVTKTQEKGE